MVERTYGIHEKKYLFTHFYEQHLVLLDMVPRNSVHRLAHFTYDRVFLTAPQGVSLVLSLR